MQLIIAFITFTGSKKEFHKIKDYKKTLDKCHSTVGIAILNTSITIVFGFFNFSFIQFYSYNLFWSFLLE